MRLFQLLVSARASVWRWFRPHDMAPQSSRQWELTAAETSAYHRHLARERAEPDVVDDRTWSDLEMEKIRLRFDQSVTPLGTQYLFSLLRNYQTQQESLEANAKAYQTFKSNTAAATDLRKALAGLNRSGSADLVDFLLGSPPLIPGAHRIFYLISVIAVACTLGIYFSAWFLPVAIALWTLNVVLYHVYGARLVRHSPALISLANLLGCVPTAAQAIQRTDLPERLVLQASVEDATRMRKQISLAFLRREGGDDFTRIITDYLNILCLFELSALCRAIEAVNRGRQMLHSIFHAVARLDALQGIASSLTEYPVACVPEIRSGRRFSLVDVQHPLVSDPVCNTIEGIGNSLLLTGTNMAGKTTFIKTLAVNLLLAQTLGVCLARAAVLSPARVRTLIARDDLIDSGQSYFYFEASELLRMVGDAEQSGREHWFVLDEIFRGTNTLDRVSAGSAVLGYLNRHGIVIASTHDHELTKLLRNDFDLYHFSEVINGAEARFDYRLRKGPCTTRNAIKLLALVGFPANVIDLAERLATRGDFKPPEDLKGASD